MNALNPAMMTQRSAATVSSKKILFLTAFFVQVFTQVYLPLMMPPEDISYGTRAFSTELAIMMFGVAFLLNMLMKPTRVFRSKGVIIFILGLFAFLTYGWLVQVSGISLYTTLRAYRRLLAMSAFYITLCLVARIIIVYDWKLEMVMIICVSLGVTIVTAYVMNFDNFAFLGHLDSIFLKDGRYRFDFGLCHVNTAGRYAMYFLVFSAIYRTLRAEKTLGQAKIDGFNMFFLLPVSIVAILMLLSTASRTSITSLILFFMVYFLLTFYEMIPGYMRFVLIVFIVMMILITIILVNWEYVLYASNREGNYDSIGVVVQKNAWLTGVGYLMYDDMKITAHIGHPDSYYLLIFLQTGIIGFLIHFGTMFYFAKTYFRDIARMTKLQRLTGALLVIYLYYGLFEASMLTGGGFDITAWALFIAAMNERVTARKNSTHILQL